MPEVSLPRQGLIFIAATLSGAISELIGCFRAGEPGRVSIMPEIIRDAGAMRASMSAGHDIYIIVAERGDTELLHLASLLALWGSIVLLCGDHPANHGIPEQEILGIDGQQGCYTLAEPDLYRQSLQWHRMSNMTTFATGLSRANRHPVYGLMFTQRDKVDEIKAAYLATNPASRAAPDVITDRLAMQRFMKLGWDICAVKVSPEDTELLELVCFTGICAALVLVVDTDPESLGFKPADLLASDYVAGADVVDGLALIDYHARVVHRRSNTQRAREEGESQ